MPKNEYVYIVYYQHFDFDLGDGVVKKSRLLFHHLSLREMIYTKSVLTLQMLHFIFIHVIHSVSVPLKPFWSLLANIQIGTCLLKFSIQIPFDMWIHRNSHQFRVCCIYCTTFRYNFSSSSVISKCLSFALRLLQLILHRWLDAERVRAKKLFYSRCATRSEPVDEFITCVM